MRRPSPAFVLSLVAVFLAGTGGAVAGVQIGGKQIKDASITGKDIKNDSLTGTDIKGNIRGPAGPAGPQGAAGPQGPAGLPAGVSVSYRTGAADIDAGGPDTVEAVCPSGQVAIAGGYISDGLTVLNSIPGGPPARPDRWVVTVVPPDDGLSTASAHVVCTTATVAAQ